MEKFKEYKQEIANKIISIIPYEKSKEKFENFIDLSKTIKNLGKWLVKWQMTSVDVTGIHNDEFNDKRYFLNSYYF